MSDDRIRVPGPSMGWLDRSFGDALTWARDTHGAREALVQRHGDTRHAMTYAQLHEAASAFARGLMESGVARGEHVALWMSDSLDWMIARWAVPMIGAVLVPINTRFRDADLRFVLAQSDTTTLILEDAAPGGRRYLDLLAQVVSDTSAQEPGPWSTSVLPALRRVICRANRDHHLVPASMTAFSTVLDRGRALLSDGRLAARLRDVRADDVAQILYTSGTTSFPKGAMVCHGALLQNNLATVARMHLTTADRYLSCVPLFSATGTSYTLSMLLAGATIVIADRFEPRLFCELVESERITVGFFVDTIVQDLRAFEGRRDYDLSSLRTGTGAPLSNDAFRFATEELGIPELIGVFGMSETSNAVARGDCADPLDKRASTNGRPVPDVEIRIADVVNNATLPADTMGEICVRGFNVMRGYYHQPDEDAKAFDADGWLHSGDLGVLDADGYLVFRGRVKEMIKPGGFNVATQEIEAFLKTHAAVREAAVVGVPDARLGEVAYAFIEREPGFPVSAEALIAHARAHIAGYKVPRHIAFVTEWPRTGSQKIRKVALKERACALLRRTSDRTAIDVQSLAALQATGTPLALFDVRDPVEAERGHVDGSTVLPRRRIEEQIGWLVQDRSTTIVVVDDGSGRAQLAAKTLAALGYDDVHWLAGGIAAWRDAGHPLSTGTNVPSKRFGEEIHHAMQVPSIDVETLLRWKAQRRHVLICDVRTPGEYRSATIPGSSSAPSFDVALGVSTMHDHDAVVVHCAGRTRSIVGAQTLRDLGVAHVFALENGTMGWRLAGETLEHDARRALPLAIRSGDPDVAARSRLLATSSGVRRIDVEALATLLATHDRNRMVFDVRGLADFEAGHLAGSRSLPGGQAIQRTDDFIAVRTATIVLVDEGGPDGRSDPRADLAALWLRRMGLPDVAVLDGGLQAWHAAGRPLAVGREVRTPLGWDAAVAQARIITPQALDDLRAHGGDFVVLDVDTSLRFNAGHLPGALWLPRGWLELRIGGIAPSQATPIVVSCVDGRQSVLAVSTLTGLGYIDACALAGGTRAWAASGRVLETAALPPQDDVSLPPYARGEQAMRDYLAWETALVDPSHDPSTVETTS